jgi:hypothetical protein
LPAFPKLWQISAKLSDVRFAAFTLIEIKVPDDAFLVARRANRWISIARTYRGISQIVSAIVTQGTSIVLAAKQASHIGHPDRVRIEVIE